MLLFICKAMDWNCFSFFNFLLPVIIDNVGKSNGTEVEDDITGHNAIEVMGPSTQTNDNNYSFRLRPVEEISEVIGK